MATRRSAREGDLLNVLDSNKSSAFPPGVSLKMTPDFTAKEKHIARGATSKGLFKGEICRTLRFSRLSARIFNRLQLRERINF